MSRRSPYVVVLSDVDKAVLEESARAYTAPFAVVVRAKIALLAADGATDRDIAARLDVHVDVVSRWRKRFVTEGLGGARFPPRWWRRSRRWGVSRRRGPRLDVEDLDQRNRCARVRRNGNAVDVIVWQTGTARLLPRLLKWPHQRSAVP